MAGSLHSLSEDIYAIVLNQIYLNAPEALPDLCLVEKRFYRHAKPLLYRSVSLNPLKLKKLDDAKFSTFIQILGGNISFFTHELLIQGNGFDWHSLARLLLELKHLETLLWRSWDQPFPQIIVDCLERNMPSAKLYVEDVPVGSTEDLEVNNNDIDLLKLSALLGSKSVRSIKANIEREDLESTRGLLEVIMSCSNLEVLHIRVPNNGTKYEWYDDDLNGPQCPHDFGALPGDKLPPLRELVYESRFTFLPGARPFIPTNCWDWSRIRHLELRGQNMIIFVKGITGQVKFLETLKVENFCSIGYTYEYATQVLSDFISEIQGLVNLELINGNTKLQVSTFAQLGATLNRLCYHKPVYPWVHPASRYAIPLSPEELGSISKGCPHLTSLTLHMLIDDDLVPYKFLAAISRINNLETLRLYAVIRYVQRGWNNLHPEYRVTHLETDILTVRHLAEYLCNYKVGCKFRRIEIVLGDYDKDNHGDMNLERPIILFTCHIQPNGGIVIEDDRHTIQDPC